MPYKGTTFTILALMATVTIWSTDPLWTWGYEIAVFTLAGWECLRPRAVPSVFFPLTAIGLWGFIQLALGSTVYRSATVNASLQNLALVATALGSYYALRDPLARAAFLRNVAWIGLVVSIVGVMAYWTSIGKILWIFSAAYPDNWGFFPSRNNFAQFLELCFPVALHSAVKSGAGGGKPNWSAAISAAVMLGAGLASASRAGAVLLVVEAVAVVWLTKGRKHSLVLAFAGCAAAIAALAGAGTLVHRFAEDDPLQVRREIFRSTGAMIARHPLQGYGLGTYSTVYPEFAEFDNGATVDHAHNDWLEWASEGGVLYAAMWGLIVIWAVGPALRSIWGIGLLAVFLHALVDYPLARLGVSAWVFLLLGALAREAGKSDSARPQKKKRKLRAGGY